MENGLKFPKMSFVPATSQTKASITLKKIAVDMGNCGYVYYAIEVEGIEALMNKYYAGPDAEMLATVTYLTTVDIVKAFKIPGVTFVNELEG
jgi:hypothetical protein